MKLVSALRNNEYLRSEGFQKYFKNTFWLIAEKISTYGLSFVVGALIARYLGTVGYGELAYAQSLFTLAFALLTLGLDNMVVKDLVDHRQRSGSILGTVLGLRLAAALVGLGVAVGLFLVFGEQSRTNRLVLLLMVGGVFQSFNIIDLYFQSRVESRYSVRVRVMQLLVANGLRLVLLVLLARHVLAPPALRAWLVSHLPALGSLSAPPALRAWLANAQGQMLHWHSPVVWFAAILLFNDVLGAAGMLRSYWQQGGRPTTWSFDGVYARRALSESWPLIVSGAVSIIFLRSDQVLIKHFLGDAQVGIHAVAIRLSEIWAFVPLAVAGSVFPALMNAKAQSVTRYYERTQQLFDLMVLIALGIAIPFTLLGEQIITFMYGEPFRAAGRILTLHIWSGVFIYMGLASYYWLLTQKLQRVGMYLSMIGCTLNIVLNLLLLPRLGLIGAPIATLAAQLVATYLGFWFFKSTRLLVVMETRALLLHGVTQKIRRLLTR